MLYSAYNQARSSVHPSPEAPPAPLIVDPYRVLQVRRDATTFEIRHAYRRLALWHHPHRSVVPVDEGTEDLKQKELHRRKQMFEILAACYETLLDKSARKRYNVLSEVLAARRGSSATTNHHHSINHTKQNNRPLVGWAAVAAPFQYAYSLGEGGGLPSLTEASSDDDDDNGDDSSANTMATNAASLLLQEGDDEDFGTARSTDDVRQLVHHAAQQDETEFETAREGSDHAFEGSNTTIQPAPTEQFQQQGCGWQPTCWTTSPQQRRRFQSLRILDCGQASSDDDYYNNHTDEEVSLDSIDSTHRTPKLPMTQNSSNSTTDAAPDIHYTRIETNRLFGGPLQLLFRARRWKPFTDPFQVYAKVFGSPTPGDGLKDSETSVSSSSLPPLKRITHPPNDVSSLTTTAEESSPDENTTIITTSRLLHDRKIVKTQEIRKDPETGQKHCHIRVTSEALDNLPDEKTIQAPPRENVWETTFCLCTAADPCPKEEEEEPSSWFSPTSLQAWLPTCV